MLWGIAVLACVAIFICWQTSKRQTANEDPPADGAMFELVGTGNDLQRLPERFRFMRYHTGYGKERGIRSVTISVIGDRRPHETLEGSVKNLVDERLHDLRIGEDIPGTEFKVTSFRGVIAQGHDASTVTLVNKETGAEEVLPLKELVDPGDARAYFRGKAAQLGVGFSARIGETFTFPPDSGRTFRVLDIKGRGAVIERPDGTKILLTALR